MPKASLKACKIGNCPNLTDRRDNLCAGHAQSTMENYNRFERDPATSKRYGGVWRQIRERYLAAHPLCEICEQNGRLTPAALVHHKLPLHDGGTNDMSNLQALCSSCHERRHAQAGERWGGKGKVYFY